MWQHLGSSGVVAGSVMAWRGWQWRKQQCSMMTYQLNRGIVAASARGVALEKQLS